MPCVSEALPDMTVGVAGDAAGELLLLRGLASRGGPALLHPGQLHPAVPGALQRRHPILHQDSPGPPPPAQPRQVKPRQQENG